jgi:lipoprotein-anchoring transpeptidase ErfK/SrfK
MHRHLTAALFALTIIFALTSKPALANGPITVQPGDSLTSIAGQYGLSPTELAAANNLSPDAWLTPGQQLLRPQASPSPWQQPAAPTYYDWRTIDFSVPPDYAAPAVYTWQEAPAFGHRPAVPDNSWTPAVNPGNSPPPAFNTPNYPVQQPTFAAPATSEFGFVPALPVQPQAPVAPTYPARRPAPIPPALMTPNGEKWIDVNLSTQTLTAMEGQTPVFRSIVSTGLWQTPTVVGTFSIYVKYEKAGMSGGSGADAYNLPNVPYVMYFHGDYGLHGTYWHNNFGTPMSHGCVNLRTEDARWVYDWAPIGTRVVTHY